MVLYWIILDKKLGGDICPVFQGSRSAAHYTFTPKGTPLPLSTMQTFTLPSNAVHGGKDWGSVCCDVLRGIHIASLLAMKFESNVSPRSIPCRSRGSCCKLLRAHCEPGTPKGLPGCSFKCWLHQERNSFQHISWTLNCMQQDSKYG